MCWTVVFYPRRISGLKGQHDNAPCHTAKRVQSFMVDRGVDVLPWPSNSPDMNPIETLWAVIKARLRQHTLTSKKDLINKLLDICKDEGEFFSQLNETCAKLVCAKEGGHKNSKHFFHFYSSCLI